MSPIIRRRAILVPCFFACLTMSLAQSKKPMAPNPQIAVPKRIKFEIAAINDPKTDEVIEPKSTGSAVVRAQISLDRLHFSCGEIDGVYGENLRRAIAAFQRSKSLRDTGVLDRDTWTVLNHDRDARLTRYTITPQDVAGPFASVPKDMLHKAKLQYMGYSSPLEALSEKFHSSPDLLRILNPGKRIGVAGQELTVPNVLVPPPGHAARIVVSQSDRSVTAFNASGMVVGYYPASIGSDHDPLPIGTWIILGVYWYPKFHYNPRLFWDANPSHAKAVIAPGPNNPVGVVWIELSKEHYGIHGTTEPSRIGYAHSHGCVNLTNWDVAELAQSVIRGVTAILKK